jgi:hypothetical protein
MIGEQTLEGRRDNLSQANKLSRTYAVLLDALNRHRGKGGQQNPSKCLIVYGGGEPLRAAGDQWCSEARSVHRVA